MNIIVLPIDLTNLKINDRNIDTVHYTLSYFKAPDCIIKSPKTNQAEAFIRESDGIGSREDSIYEKFIPISEANFLQERRDLGFEFNIMDYDYPGCYITSELVYKRWLVRLQFEQKIDYKIRSLIDLHNIEPMAIARVMEDCNEIEFDQRADYQMALLCDVFDKDLYALYDDNIVWGVGYSEIDAFFNALENHIWLSSFFDHLDIEVRNAQEIEPYADFEQVFNKIIEKILEGRHVFDVGHNLMLRPCTKALFSFVNRRGLDEFNFTEQGGRLALASSARV